MISKASGPSTSRTRRGSRMPTSLMLEASSSSFFGSKYFRGLVGDSARCARGTNCDTGLLWTGLAPDILLLLSLSFVVGKVRALTLEPLAQADETAEVRRRRTFLMRERGC